MGSATVAFAKDQVYLTYLGTEVDSAASARLGLRKRQGYLCGIALSPEWFSTCKPTGPQQWEMAKTRPPNFGYKICTQIWRQCLMGKHVLHEYLRRGTYCECGPMGAARLRLYLILMMWQNKNLGMRGSATTYSAFHTAPAPRMVDSRGAFRSALKGATPARKAPTCKFALLQNLICRPAEQPTTAIFTHALSPRLSRGHGFYAG